MRISPTVDQDNFVAPFPIHAPQPDLYDSSDSLLMVVARYFTICRDSFMVVIRLQP